MAGQKVKVSELVVDFKKGMSTSELIQKYGVSEPQLRALTKKLVELGHLTQADIDRRAGAQAVVDPQPPAAAKPPEAPIPPVIPKTPETPQPPPAAKPPEAPIPPEPPATPEIPQPSPAAKPPEAAIPSEAPKKAPAPPQPPPVKASVDAEDAINMLGEDDRGWECPACGQRQDKKQAECPGCGVIVEKFLKRQKEIEEQKKALEEAERAAAQKPAEEKTEQESFPEGPSASVPAPDIPPEVSETPPIPHEAPAAVPESGAAPETEPKPKPKPKPEEDVPLGTKPARVPIRLPGFLSKSPLLTGGVALGVVLMAVAAILLSSRSPGMPKKSREWVVDKLTDLPMGYIGKTYAGKDRRTPIGLYLKVKDVKILDVAESSLIPAGEVLKSYCMKLEVTSDVHTGPVLPQEYLQRYRKYASTDGWDYHQGWEKIIAKTSRYKEFTTIFNTMVDLTKPKESGRKFDTHFSQMPQPKVIYTGDNCPNEWDKFCPFGCKAE